MRARRVVRFFQENVNPALEVRYLYQVLAPSTTESAKWICGLDNGSFIERVPLCELEIVDNSLTELAVVRGSGGCPMFVHQVLALDSALLSDVMNDEFGAYNDFVGRID